MRPVLDTNVLIAAIAADGPCRDLVRSALIITGDNDLLVLKKFRSIRILSPRQVLEILHSK